MINLKHKWPLAIFVQELAIAERRRRGEKITEDMNPRREYTLKDLFLPRSMRGGAARWYSVRQYLSHVMGPYILSRFVLLPLPLLVLPLAVPAVGARLALTGAAPAAVGGSALAMGTTFFRNAFINLVLADILTNVHSFLMIMPNHCGKDLYRFERSCQPNSGTFYMRQVRACSEKNLLLVLDSVFVLHISSLAASIRQNSHMFRHLFRNILP